MTRLNVCLSLHYYYLRIIIIIISNNDQPASQPSSQQYVKEMISIAFSHSLYSLSYLHCLAAISLVDLYF
jgi:hypothetical protein